MSSSSGDLSQKPKGFDKVIDRLRKSKIDKDMIKEKVLKHSIGERYDKVRLSQVQPPKFLLEQGKEVPRWKKEPLVTLEIKINPKK